MLTNSVPSSLYPCIGIEYALRTLIECTKEAYQHERFKEFCKGRDYLSIIKEMCTIRVAGPRMAGHTTAMLKCAQECERPAIITYSITVEDDLRKYHPEAVKLKNAVWASSYNFKTALRGCTLDAIFVDMASFVSKTKQDEIAVIASACGAYQIGSGKSFLLVFLQ